MATDSLQAFLSPSEDTTLDGACEALHEAVSAYTSALKSGLGRKTKDNTEWKRVVSKYYGLSRLSQGRWEEVCDRVVEMGLLEIQESDGGREYWKPSELELHEDEKNENTSSGASSNELELPDEDVVSWDYQEPQETEEEQDTDSWEGFSPEELEVIEILNIAYLRGHTLYEQGDKPSFYDAHRWALVHNKPLAEKARLRINEHGQSFGYCHNSDGRYTGGVFNCAVLSASYGAGIMSVEEKERVKSACVRACPSCPNKKYSKQRSKD